ncbi:MAG: hypothetical protein ACQEWU_05240 [Bacillota bacterium]
MHLQAWLHHVAGSTKEQGKKQVPVYKNFKQFFDYEKRIKEVDNPKDRLSPQMKQMAYLAMQINSGEEV